MYKFFFIVLLSLFVFAQDIVIEKKEKIGDEYRVELKLLEKLTINSITLFNGDSDFNLTYTNIENELTLYFLIDTSSPMKSSFKRGIRPLLLKLDKNRTVTQKWIVSEFSQDLHTIYNEYNSTSQSLLDSLNNLKIRGRVTKFWKNTHSAIDTLNIIGGSKKILIISSDGDAEDRAYTIDSVIEKAKEDNIKIISLGYRDRGDKKSNPLESLERIAKDTQGKFWKANKRDKLPKNFIEEFNQILKNIANENIEVILPIEATKATASGKRSFTITIEHTLGTTKLNFSLDVDKNQSIVTKNLSSSKSFWELYQFYIIGLFLLILFLIYLFLKQNRKKKKEETSDAIVKNKVLMEHKKTIELKKQRDYVAYFESLESNKKYYIYTFPSTIGSENTSVLIDKRYISRKHAILDFDKGYFFISDNQSKNGLFVNDKEVKREQLRDGDKVSFGPFDTIFKLKQ